MRKKILTAIVAMVMAVLFVTSVSADNPCPFCGGTLINQGCGFTNIDDCSVDEAVCDIHNSCILQTYRAYTKQKCASCNNVIIGANNHPHAIGHRNVGSSYPYSMSTVCPWW